MFLEISTLDAQTALAIGQVLTIDRYMALVSFVIESSIDFCQANAGFDKSGDKALAVDISVAIASQGATFTVYLVVKALHLLSIWLSRSCIHCLSGC